MNRENLQKLVGPMVAHDGEGCPVPGNTIVDVLFADGEVVCGKRAEMWNGPSKLWSNWIWDGPVAEGAEIVSYRAIAATSPESGQ